MGPTLILLLALWLPSAAPDMVRWVQPTDAFVTPEAAPYELRFAGEIV